jgi:ligand-binding sensor domain-containing protein
VTSIREDKEGKIWIATDRGLNVLENDKIRVAGLRGKSLLNITFDSQGNLWAGCWRAASSGGGLFKYDGKQWESFSTRTGLPGLEILKVFEDSKGHIWIGTYEFGGGAGVSCYDGRNWKIYNQKNGLINDCVYSMFEDPLGNMWFGTVGGISIFDHKEQWHSLSARDGLVDDQVYCMYIDSNKKMWFGTERGVSRFDGENWISFTEEEHLIENLVRSITEDSVGNIWFGTYPYAPGRGGISIAKYSKSPEKLAKKVAKYLPDKKDMKYLESKEIKRK